MANLKASKKDSITSEKNRMRNVARKSEIRTTTKKLMEALAVKDIEAAKKLMKATESKISRAETKGVLKKETASRKIGRLAKKVATLVKSVT
ncbi:30S ribosomal protein S20 [Candidatus Dependentiae bacterium]|nr:MAG: 30S ribosomal protein S20 [Candidatus Dependentiae bacterium]